MSTLVSQEYLSVGGNRHTAASSWSSTSGLLAFGAAQNVALWDVLGEDSRGIEHLLQGHKEKVTAVEFLRSSTKSEEEWLISGSADGKLIASTRSSAGQPWKAVSEIQAHEGAVNCIATIVGSGLFVTGGADARIKVWTLQDTKIVDVLDINPKPRLIPLTFAIGHFPEISLENAFFLAVGGTRNDVQVYSIQNIHKEATAEHQATLSGHEGWIRSLAIKTISANELLLASASHDKYVRLWRFDHGSTKTTNGDADRSHINGFEQTLTAKVQKVSVPGKQYSITFEALLLGHEDWVYSAAWNPNAGSEQLLTASADGSLTIWELDQTSGIWISASRLGEISGQKGATTATGSSGGFWTAMWSPDGQWVTCLGRTGSWRIWHFDQTQQYWVQKHGVSGHVSAANGLTWSARGDYLLSTSSDQTTRLHAEWKRNSKRTWHEFARPQIHGYDLNCISSTGSSQFVSGADEKLLRVFNEPKDIAKMLSNLCNIEAPEDNQLSETAAIPVLGLSNKAIDDDDEEGIPQNPNGMKEPEYITPDASISTATLQEPPSEDLLARHTLWPEHEKLYGHGYEISESAYSATNHILATACKASSTDHAVIRLYDTRDWHEIKPPLTAHSLTVTRLLWSTAPANFLLSVGRDRQWTLFKQNGNAHSWELLQSNPKAHTRMILDAAWSPNSNKLFFATAGRDKTIKLWHDKSLTTDPNSKPNFEEYLSIKRETAITALTFTTNHDQTIAVLAAAEENGGLSIHFFDIHQDLKLVGSIDVDQLICPSKSATRISWRPFDNRQRATANGVHLAVAAADGSVMILNIDIEQMVNSL